MLYQNGRSASLVDPQTIFGVVVQAFFLYNLLFLEEGFKSK